MTSKSKSDKAALRETDQPEIAVEFSDEEINQSSEAIERAEDLTRRIREAIHGPEGASTPPHEDEGPGSDKTTPLSAIDGIGPAYKKALKEQGIMSVEMLITADANSLAKKTRFSAETIREWQEKGKSLVRAADVERKEPETPEETAESEEQQKRDKDDRLPGQAKIERNVEKIKSKDGVIGYILRNATSASIDLKDPAKITDYALLSSSALEASNAISDILNLGEIKRVLVEGNTIKLVSLTFDHSKVSVFMEKKVDHKRVCAELRR